MKVWGAQEEIDGIHIQPRSLAAQFRIKLYRSFLVFGFCHVAMTFCDVILLRQMITVVPG